MLIICTVLSINSLFSQKARLLAKFEPKNGQCLFFIGQDMPAIGGIDGYRNGYCDFFNIPTGITGYTNFSPGEKSFGHVMRGNDGFFSLANWGSGDSYLDFQVKQPGFENSLVAIGLAFVDNEEKISNGESDSMIVALGSWIKMQGKRPVFLRIGYEFDGHEWNHYNRKYYLQAWHRIVDKMREMNVDNVAFIWQSKGFGSTLSDLKDWYPGNNYVDWCAFSYFSHPNDVMVQFARKQGKPVFIAEATPVFQMEGNQIYYDCDIKKPIVAEKMWNEWYVGFFNTIEKNSDVIKAFSYINTNWPSEAMWINNATFNQVDARVQKSDYVSKLWKEKVSNARYLKPTNQLFDLLWNNNE